MLLVRGRRLFGGLFGGEGGGAMEPLMLANRAGLAAEGARGVAGVALPIWWGWRWRWRILRRFKLDSSK